MWYTLKALEARPTLRQGHTADLKMQFKAKRVEKRVWLSRMTVEDGMPYNNQVTIEAYGRNGWETIKQFEAR